MSYGLWVKRLLEIQKLFPTHTSLNPVLSTQYPVPITLTSTVDSSGRADNARHPIATHISLRVSLFLSVGPHAKRHTQTSVRLSDTHGSPLSTVRRAFRSIRIRPTLPKYNDLSPQFQTFCFGYWVVGCGLWVKRLLEIRKVFTTKNLLTQYSVPTTL